MSLYKEAMIWLEKLQTEGSFFRKGGYVPSVKITHKFLDKLNRPELSCEERIIVGGSAGKGTVCRKIEATLLAEGKSVLLISSPHLQVITERIRINGKLISAEKFGKYILEVKKIAEDIGNPTYYEANVLAGILASREEKVDILILEVGCGGDFDATHGIEGSRIAGVTFIGHDHLELFGGSLENTASAKSGIFDVPDLKAAFSCEKKFRDIFNKRSTKPIKYIGGVANKLNKKLARNICAEVLGHKDFSMEREKMPCRWERIQLKNNQKLILDGAHGRERFEYIKPKIHKIKTPKIGILSMKYTANLEDLKIIESGFDVIIITTNETKKKARQLASMDNLKKVFPESIVSENPKNALKMAQEIGKEKFSDSDICNIVVMGSLYLCAEIRDIFYDSEKILETGDEFYK